MGFRVEAEELSVHAFRVWVPDELGLTLAPSIGFPHNPEIIMAYYTPKPSKDLGPCSMPEVFHVDSL